jgi:hypothetical protein
VTTIGNNLKRQNLKDLRDINKKIQEESQYWSEKEDEMGKELANARNCSPPRGNNWTRKNHSSCNWMRNFT